MKLILGSDFSFLEKYGYDLVGIPKADMKVGYITTAAKGARDQDFFKNVKRLIHEHGVEIFEYDIEGKSREDILSFFADKNVIHLEGGNTFYLLNAVRGSGFAEALKEMLDSGKVFIGTSAGAYIMCPTIEVADWDKTGKSRYEVTDFTAFGYVPFVLKVHYKDTAKEQVLENMKSLTHHLRILKDGQGLLVEDGRTTFFGQESEVLL